MKTYWPEGTTWAYVDDRWQEVYPAPIKMKWGIFYTGKLDWGWCLDLHGRHQIFDSINEAHQELERWRGETGEWMAYQVKERRGEGEVG